MWIERRILGRHFIKTKDYEKAYKITAQHGLVPGGDFADAEFLAGWLSLYHLDKPVQAARHFRRLFENVKRPISIARATFWLAETANRLGRADTAVTWYVKAAKHPDTYYGQLAQDRISAQTGLAPPPRQLTQANASKAPTKANELVTVVRYLDSVGENKLVGRFLHHMRQTAETSADFESLAGLAKSINRPDLMLRIAREASWQHVSLPDAAYPVDVTPGYGNMSEAVALLPEEALIYAIQRQESAFKVDAKSHAGARGLMQLMPGTARLVAKNIGITYRPEGLLNDPAYNLLLGASYLSQMIERFDGSYILAIAAYNAGPHRVDRWLKDYGDPRTDEISAIDWVEHIPFTETRNYVQRVTEAILPYRSRLGSAQGDQSLIAILSRHTMPGSEVANAD
ncbi:MAG: transglycosylase SLT domain-containing protein [Alphaproteobacteria bacterium]